MNYADRTTTYASDIFIVRFFWKTISRNQGQYLQLTLSRMAYTGLMSDMDNGIRGILYKVIDSNKDVHRINKYDIRNFVAWEPKNHASNNS